MAAKLRMGLIGCGFYAQNHLNAWRDRDNLKTYALVEAAYESAASHQAVRPKM